MHLFFYLSYALRNLWRSRRWSAFAIFSVAAGVATMVALRSLGLSIGDSLTADVRATNKGDITISIEGERMLSALTDSGDDAYNFRDDVLRRLETWTAGLDGTMTTYRFTAGSQLTHLDAVTVGRPQFINTFYIDPASYPLTRDVYADDPRGVPLGQLFTGAGHEVVISRNLADRENIHVGDHVRVSSTEQEFVVRGIVPTAAQAGLYQFFSREALSIFFGFAYFDRAAVRDVLDVNLGVNRVSITFPEGTRLDTLNVYGVQVWDVLQGGRGFASYRVRTTRDMLQTFEFISDALGRFIVVLGLGAMLLGGVGIINTMLVLVRRRTEEIAALKTFGVKGRQVAFMFFAEALWIGIFGSLIGGVAGVLLGFLTNRFGADLIQQPLTSRVYPEAVLFGAALGVVVSAVFGILPVLSAAKVRPSVLLRPGETGNFTAGCLPRILALGFVVLVLGWIAGEILPVPFDWFFDVGIKLPTQTFGIVGVALTLLVLFLLACLLWLLVWLIGKIPSFGNVDLQLALRNLTTHRMRTAITLLALASGMFALSSIAFFGESAREILQFTLSNALGGNVLILPILPQEIARPIIDARLLTLPGIESRTRVMNYTGYISALNGERPEQIGGANSLQIFVRDTNDPDWTVPGIVAGRTLTQADRGRPVAVIQEAQLEFDPGIPLAVGDLVTLNTYSRTSAVTVEIVGIASASTSTILGGLWVAPNVLPASAADFTLTLARVAPEHLNTVLIGLSSLPLVLTFDVSFFDGILTRLITQFSALPLLVGLLSLGAAAVITANTVALATLERRRQMGVLRAIGLKSGRVLRVLLLENIIVSLLGALIGIGLSALGVALITHFSLDAAILIPRGAIPIAVVLVIIAVTIGALATLASGSVAVRERVMNTLRYE